MPDATVIIAAWNAEATLVRAVKSALAQTVPVEVVIVDDASTDETARVAQGLARDPRVKLIRQSENAGPAAARNAGLDAASSAWVAVLDADDTMRPDRLERMMELAARTGADAVYDNLLLVDADGWPLSSVPYVAGRNRPEAWTLSDFLAGNQARPGRASLGYLKPLLRNSFLKAYDLRYDETLRNGEDFHLMLALLTQGGRLWFLPEAGYFYTTQKGSISNRLDPLHARALASADAAFLARWGKTLDMKVRAQMHLRQKRIASLAAAESAMRALKSGRPDRALGALARQPFAATRFLRQLAQAVGNRL